VAEGQSKEISHSPSPSRVFSAIINELKNNNIILDEQKDTGYFLGSGQQGATERVISRGNTGYSLGDSKQTDERYEKELKDRERSLQKELRDCKKDLKEIREKEKTLINESYQKEISLKEEASKEKANLKEEIQKINIEKVKMEGQIKNFKDEKKNNSLFMFLSIVFVGLGGSLVSQPQQVTAGILCIAIGCIFWFVAYGKEYFAHSMIE